MRRSKAGVIAAVRSLDIGEAAAILDADPSLLNATGAGGRNLLHLACAVRRRVA